MTKTMTAGGGELVHLGVNSKRFVEMPREYVRDADYLAPRTYLAYETDNCGNRLSDRSIRVRIDHTATGTGHSGSGDTIARRV